MNTKITVSPRTQSMSYKTKKAASATIYHLFVIAFGFVMIYPLLWMVGSSLKPQAEIFGNAYSLIPSVLYPANYANGWKGFGGFSFARFFSNSLTISALATLGSVVSAPFVAFGFARLRFKGRNIWFGAMMLTLMLPFQIIMIPQYIIFHRIGWVNTILPLVAPNWLGGAFFVFLVMQFIDGIPRELDEAAFIDGCSWYGIYLKVILPLIIPAVVTVGIFSFMWKWDDFLGALLYLNRPADYTVSVALRMFSDPASNSDWGALFAMASLSIAPIMIIFIFCQKYLVEGISTEGLKV